MAFSGVRGIEQDIEFMLLLHPDGGKLLRLSDLSKEENDFFTQELIPLCSHAARKCFSRSDPNLSSCG